MHCVLYETLAVLLLCALGQHVAFGDHEEDNWIEPNAWAREELQLGADGQLALGFSKATGSGQGPGATVTSPPCGEAVALVYYKKLVAHLFRREKLMYDETNAVFRRNVVFTLLPAQLELLEQLGDVRDIDSVLTEILANNKFDFADERGSGGVTGIIALCMDIVKDLLQLLKISEFRFVVVVMSFLLLGWLVHRHYRIGILSMVFGFILIFGYFHTYLECNRKLEAERMLEALEKHQIVEEIKPSWYSPILSFFTWNEPVKQTRQEFIKQNSKLNLAFCRPDHVLVQYVNDLFLTQLELLIEKCTSSFMTLRESLPFPFNYLAAFSLVVLIVYILKLSFKYILSPRAWASLLHSNVVIGNHPPQQHKSLSDTPSIEEDRLSGENLRRLLSLFGSSGPNMFVVNNLPPVAGSGVEEVREQLEPAQASPSPAKTAASNTPNTPVTEQQSDQHNNNTESCAKEFADEKGVRLEELSDDGNS